MDKKKNNNISSVALETGISEEGFTKLLDDIKVAVNDSSEVLNKRDELVNELRNIYPSDETEEWIKKFESQAIESNDVISENLKNIEELFERIFNDWNEYQKNDVEEDKGDTNE